MNAVFQDWPLARVSPAWVCGTGMFGPLLPRSDPFTADYNKILDLFIAFIKQTTQTIVNRACWYLYGNAEFGDFRNSAFCNVPTEDTYAFFIEFLRGGDREWARLGARGARHYADIDVCHADTVESDVGRPWIVPQYGGARNPTVTAGSTQGFQYDMLGSTGAVRATLDAQIQSNETAFAAVSVPRDAHQLIPWRDSAAVLVPWCNHLGGALPYFMVSGDRRATEVLQEQCGWVRAARQAGTLPVGYYTFRVSAFMDTYEATGDGEYLSGATGVVNELIADWKLDGYWYSGYAKHGNSGIIESSRLVRSLFRFLDVNVPEAGTGVNNNEVKQMIADCVRTPMLDSVQAQGCTPGYLGAWAMAESLGLWQDEARAIFEEKALMIVSIGRKTLPYENIKDGLAVCPPLQYKVPFLQYVWNNTTQTGKFVTCDPVAMALTNILNRSIHEFTCDMAEYGISYAMPGYPHFMAAWKNYHQTRIAPRMDTNGVLNFIIEPSAQPNSPPTCAIMSPGGGTTYTAPATVVIDANASDGTGTVVKVEFYQGAVKLGEDMTSPYGYTWPDVAAGTYTLTVCAIDNVGATGTSTAVSITVYPEGSSPPTVTNVAAASPSPVTGTTASLTVLGADDAGESALTYTWATSGTPPAAVTFSPNGNNAAKNTTATFTKAGSYTLQATIKDAGDLTAASSVGVTVNQTLTSITVTPASVNVAMNSTQAFVATAKDQFVAVLVSQPVIAWTVSGGGAIGTNGLFTAGVTAGGPHTVTALSGGKSGTANVTVTEVNLNPIAHWMLDETSGVKAVDASGNGHTGTLASAMAWTNGVIGGAVR
ncbi:MAG: Ig-like domain-containing protein, partial [Kiritimatiellae bacterium]|nr:Ig-like domain-containing protein [Kiritimatiellia bacterium]